MTPTVLYDADIDRLSLAEAIDILVGVFQARASHGVVAPPRWSVTTPQGSLVFTAGAVLPQNVIGARAYTTMSGHGSDVTQYVSVFDGTTGVLHGIVIGNRLGQLRNAAIGGVAARYLANPDAAIVGVIGAGHQAHLHLLALAAVHRLRAIRIFSPTQAHRTALALDIGRALNVPVAPVNSAEGAVRDADLVLLVTTSAEPVLDGQWLKPGAHVHSLGPKRKDRHELDQTTLDRASLVTTDAPHQLAVEGEQGLLYGTPWQTQLTDLADVVAGRVKRPDARAITVFLSAGLAGTEVALAAWLIGAPRPEPPAE